MSGGRVSAGRDAARASTNPVGITWRKRMHIIDWIGFLAILLLQKHRAAASLHTKCSWYVSLIQRKTWSRKKGNEWARAMASASSRVCITGVGTSRFGMRDSSLRK